MWQADPARQGLLSSNTPAAAAATTSSGHAADSGLTPGLDTELRRWLADTVGERVDHRLTVSPESAQDPYRTPDDAPRSRHWPTPWGEGSGASAGRMGNAGGGPAVWLTQRLGAPVVYFGTGLPEDHGHDSNEQVSIDVLLSGAATLAALWDRLPSV